jgi:hypothetical protein
MGIASFAKKAIDDAEDEEWGIDSTTLTDDELTDDDLLGGTFFTEFEDLPELDLSYEGQEESSADPLAGWIDSVDSTPLDTALTDPDYTTGLSTSEQALINDAMDYTQGRTAVSGLGPATQESLIAGIAPTLVDLSQSEIGNLMAAQGLKLTEREQDISQRATDAGTLLAQQGYATEERGQDIQAELQDMGYDVSEWQTQVSAIMQQYQISSDEAEAVLAALLQLQVNATPGTETTTDSTAANANIVTPVSTVSTG